MNSVFLKPTHLTQFRGSEPQYLQIRSTNKNVMYIDSQNSNCPDKADLDIFIEGAPTSILFQNVSRITPTDFGFSWITPNINVRNNNITFRSSNTGATIHSVFLNEGFYITPTLIMDEVVRAMNTLTGTTGLTFSHTGVTGLIDKFNLVAAGGLYHLELGCNAITRGLQLYNLPTDQILTNTKVVGTVLGYYTRYIDVLSSMLTKHEKTLVKSNGIQQTILFRAYLQTPYQVGYFERKADELGGSFNWDPNEYVTHFDLKIVDQFGDKLYIPQKNNDNQSGFNFDIEIMLEM